MEKLFRFIVDYRRQLPQAMNLVDELIENRLYMDAIDILIAQAEYVKAIQELEADLLAR